jgi:hypothetical protein
LAFLRTRVPLLICALVAIGCKDKPTTGALVVTVNGLPAAAPASVTVSGPEQFSKQVAQTTTLENLVPGEYTVRMQPVHFSNALYSSPVLTEVHRITAGHTEAVTVPYALASGSIDLSVSGLPGGTGPSVLLTGGPNNSSRLILVAGIIGELDPGTYELRADTLRVPEGDLFGPTPFTQSVTVAKSLTPVPASVAYVLASGSLAVTVNGLPANQTPAPVTVTGPGSFARQVAVTTTYRGLVAGTYTIAAASASNCPNIYTPAVTQQTADVAIGATATATVSYAQSQPPAANLNLKIDALHLVQVVQDYAGITPMVAGKPALLRVFALANQCNTAMPKVRITLSTGRSFDILASESSVRQTSDQGVLVSSWNATLPAADVQPGLTVVAVIDPDNTIAEANETDNRYPASGTKTIDVRTMPTVSIRFVPVTVAGSTGNVTDARVDSLLQSARRIHPAFAYDADVRAPYTSSQAAFKADGGSWAQVLGEIRALRLADSSNRYYHGIVKVTYNSGVAGIGYVGERAALSWDYWPSVSDVVAHELGHNYGRFHTPCGNPSGIDPNYPNTGQYVGGHIGAYGYDIDINTLKEPSFYTDIMGYCSNKWISDYTYFGMMQWMIDHPTSLPDVASAAVQPSLLIWGRIANGQPVLEPAFEINARAQLPRSSGPNRITAVDDAGSELFSYSFAGDRIADLPGDQESFAFAMPLSMLRGRTLASLKLSAGGRSVSNVAAGDVAGNTATVLTRAGAHQVRVQWDASKFPAVMVRDPVKGDILSFARGGDATIVTDNTQLELVYSNRVRSVRERIQVR